MSAAMQSIFQAKIEERIANVKHRGKIRSITDQDISYAANELAAIRALATSRVELLVRKAKVTR